MQDGVDTLKVVLSDIALLSQETICNAFVLFLGYLREANISKEQYFYT
jgi:hypothetical protein